MFVLYKLILFTYLRDRKESLFSLLCERIYCHTLFNVVEESVNKVRAFYENLRNFAAMFKNMILYKKVSKYSIQK